MGRRHGGRAGTAVVKTTNMNRTGLPRPPPSYPLEGVGAVDREADGVAVADSARLAVHAAAADHGAAFYRAAATGRGAYFFTRCRACMKAYTQYGLHWAGAGTGTACPSKKA